MLKGLFPERAAPTAGFGSGLGSCAPVSFSGVATCSLPIGPSVFSFPVSWVFVGGTGGLFL
ncbi:MAG: hypothetical protein CR994_05695 [Maribacter sp.]|nr:MAG: hypothetical protein CR994_05695 [Maribacter sp.]